MKMSGKPKEEVKEKGDDPERMETGEVEEKVGTGEVEKVGTGEVEKVGTGEEARVKRRKQSDDMEA